MNADEAMALLYYAGQSDSRNYPAAADDRIAKASVWAETLPPWLTLAEAKSAVIRHYQAAVRIAALQPADIIEAARYLRDQDQGRPTPIPPPSTPKRGMPVDFWEIASLEADPPYTNPDGTYCTTGEEFMAEANRRRKAAGLPASNLVL